MAHLLAALARDRRYLEPRALPAQAAQDRRDAPVRVFGEVRLVEQQPARLAVQRGVVFFQLENDRLCVPNDGAHGVSWILALVERGDVDDMQEQPGSLEVAQELPAEPAALAGALDQAGEVGDHKPRYTVAHHAEGPVDPPKAPFPHLRPP